MIEKIYLPFLQQLQLQYGEERFVFTNENLPQLSDKKINLSDIIITKKWHCYNDNHRVEMLDVSCAKPYYQILGLLILDYLFHKKDIEIELTNPLSTIKKIRIGDKTNPQNKHFGLLQHNYAYNYWAAEITHRYALQNLSNFPNFNLTNDDGKSMLTEAEIGRASCRERVLMPV